MALAAGGQPPRFSFLTRGDFFAFLHRDAPILLAGAVVLLLLLEYRYVRLKREARGYVHDTRLSVESHRAQDLFSRYPRMARLRPMRDRWREWRDRRRQQREAQRQARRRQLEARRRQREARRREDE